MSRKKPEILISDSNGKIYNLPYLEATGMKGGHFFRLAAQELIKLPYGSELFMLPDRIPVGYDSVAKKYVKLYRNPLSRKNKKCFAVAAFISPCLTVTYNSSYAEIDKPAMPTLFSYAAVTFYKGEFYAACF